MINFNIIVNNGDTCSHTSYLYAKTMNSYYNLQKRIEGGYEPLNHAPKVDGGHEITFMVYPLKYSVE